MPNQVQERPATEHLKTYDELCTELQMLKVSDISSYDRVLDEIVYWALGPGNNEKLNAKRLSLYPGFSDEDFSRLLYDLKEEDRLLAAPSDET